ncbi:MAG: AAA family ATPase [Candidatus Omnitrophica bacterium]|nr:AAA family ATPase [Candidatus Omnitrophota bacterium]
MFEQIEINQDFQQALDLVENTDESVFITGRAGCGKSTLLRYLKSHTKKNAVVLAPTGVAAINVMGQTIHSFFKFPPQFIDKRVIRKMRNREIFKNIELIIIDEISMVRADLMDGIDHALRINRGFDLPFGGAQVVMFGDLFQLPPVIRGEEMKNFFQEHYGSAYFFNAAVFLELDLRYIELHKIYRQSDEKFINLLDRVRSKEINQGDLSILNQRFLVLAQDLEHAITLTTTNRIAAQVNDYHLNKLDGNAYQFQAEIAEQFDESFFPTEYNLKLKKNAQIMMIMNDPQKRWVNGSIGQIEDLANDFIRVRIGDKVHEIKRSTWHKIEYKYDKENKHIIEDITGTFMQYPLRLAWAITIHKSQGKTFENVIIDLGYGAFAHGQVYVALSRCVSLGGIVLKRPIRADDIIFDEKVYEFRRKFITK